MNTIPQIIPRIAQTTNDEMVLFIEIFHNTAQSMFYVGSTFKMLRDRMSAHISDCKRTNNTFYQYVNQFGWDNVCSDNYEEMKYVTEGELRYREGQYQKLYDPPLNTYIA